MITRTANILDASSTYLPTKSATIMKSSQSYSRYPLAKIMLCTLVGTTAFSAWGQTQVLQPSSARGAQAVESSTCDINVTSGVVFKSGDDGSFIDAINSRNSNLPVAADQGLWLRSQGLPQDAKLLLSLSDVKANADGRSVLRVGIKAFDANGQLIQTPVKILVETSLGRLSLGASNQQLNKIEFATSTGQGCVNLVSPTVAGESILRVSSGLVKVQGQIDFVPDLRSMLVVGIVEGSLSLTKFKKDALTPTISNTDFDETLRNFENTNESDDGLSRKTAAGRAALFVKGTVKGEYLLTAAYDSDKIVQQKLFRDIDPNAFYPIYGDASVRSFDAQSKSRLYVRVDKNKSYLLYGDFATAVADEGVKLAAYSRSLTGTKVHYQNDSAKINLWATQDTLRAYVDEQPGQGISGPYAVGRPNAVANSEKVELLVRDRVQNSVIIKYESLVRFTDYDFEPFSGKLLFRKPVPSVDEQGNPVSIKITYEVDDGGEKFWVGGVDGQVKLGPVLLGASHVEDKNTVSGYKLSGINAQIKLGQQLFVVAELAKSEGTQFYNQSIESITQQTTGYSSALGGLTPASISQSGQAARLEIRQNSETLQARAFIIKADKGFQSSNAGTNPGRTEVGATGTLKVNSQVDLTAKLMQTKDDLTTSKRDSASLGANYKFSPQLMLDASVNRVKENGVVGGLSIANSQNGLSNLPGLGWGSTLGYGTYGTGLLGSSPYGTGLASSNTRIDNEYTSLKARLTGKVTENASLYAEYEQGVDDSARRRSALGGEYRISDKSRLYARYEFENTLSSTVNGLNLDGVSTQTSVIGVDTAYMKDGQLFSEYRLTGGQNGLDASTAVGVRNQWAITDGLTINTSAERQSLRPYGNVKSDAVALSLGALYSANPVYKLGGKVEYRTSTTTDQWNSTLALDRKLNNDWSALARNLYMYTHDRLNSGAGNQTQNRFQLGLAYRSKQTNVFHGLIRIEHRLDNSSAILDPRQSTSNILSLHGNYHAVRSTTLTGQMAYKSVNETFNAVPSNWRGTLLSGRVTYDINDRFDIGLMSSILKGNGASTTGLGVEAGAKLIEDMWLGLSYNRGKFADSELFSSNATWTGWRLRLKYKFN